MVGGRNTIERRVCEVEQLLRQYKKRIYISKVSGEKDEKVELMDRCLACLSHYERDLIKNLLIENVSERDCAKLTGLTRYRVRKEKERLLSLTSAAFEKLASGK